MAVKNRFLSDDRKYQLISEYLDSGLDLKTWCKENSIGASTIYEWKKALIKKGYNFGIRKKDFEKRASKKDKYWLLCRLFEECENLFEAEQWCLNNGVTFKNVVSWKNELDRNGYPFDKYESPLLHLIEQGGYYNNSDYDSCFDFNPIGEKIYGRTNVNKKVAPIYLYPGNEEYKWIVFRWDSNVSVLETARSNGMDVWLWNRENYCWELLMKNTDTEEEFREENLERFKNHNIRQYKSNTWTYLSQFLIPWSDEEIEAMEKDYWEKVSSYNGAKL